MVRAPQSWQTYLDAFHFQRPGITEDVLSKSYSRHGLTPYEWVTAPVPCGARTLDLACGSGPCLRLRLGEPWIGVDRSREELARAHAGGTPHVLEANATALPFADTTFDAVVSSMAVMLVQPLRPALDEVRRVLRPGGLFVLTMPGRRPLRLRDVARYVGLLGRMRCGRLSYPNASVMSRHTSFIESCGFRVVEDVRQRFAFSVDSAGDGALFVRSLYLPDIDVALLRRGEKFSAAWVGGEIGIPLRRMTLERE